jgi:Protein of unknown function (DUF3109)
VLIIDDVVVHEEVLKSPFVCDLNACKGACCIEGDGGAPLTFEEAALLDEHLEAIAPFMASKGLETARREGTFYVDELDREFATQLVEGRECVFAYYDHTRTLKCAVEDAHTAGAIDFQKPISCHLYPIRIAKRGNFEHLLYHEWEICSPACSLGQKLNVPLFAFLKDALIRKYGPNWYEALEQVATSIES